MNRRDLLKALIASPIAAAAGVTLIRTAKAAPQPVTPGKDFEVWESLTKPAECTYSTSIANAPELGQEVSIEWNGEVIFVGTVDRRAQGVGESVEIHASAKTPEVTVKDYRELWDEADVNEYAERHLLRTMRRG